MTLTPAEFDEVVGRLRQAEARRLPIAPLTEAFPGIDSVDAYQVQLANIEHRVARGSVIRGHKVGLSSKAMQQMMGVTEPDYGHLLDDMFILEGDSVAASRFCCPRVEVEVAFVLGRALPAPGCTAADVLRATDFVLPAIEIIDSRITDWQIKLADTISDNASSAAVVLGGKRTAPADLDLRTIGAVLRRNGEIIDTGAAGAVLGNPVTAVAWLANTVHTFGVALEAGHVILPGSCTRAADVSAGDVIRAEFDTLGYVSVTFT